jgi:hypothetical protein
MIGSFQAQYFRFLSFDPNTIFQFFVSADRFYLVKVGSALNQLPQVMRLAKGPVGLSEIATAELPAEADAQKLVRADHANYEVTFAELTACVLKTKHWLGGDGSLTLQSTKRGKLYFRFLDQTQWNQASKTLRTALRNRFTVE